MTLMLPGAQTFLTALVGVAPERTRHVAPELALQRLNYVTGRTLTETAVETEQAWVEARLGVAGRWLSAGIVEGLEIGLADQAAEPGRFTLGAGRGIAPGGQDVAVLKAASLALGNLPLLGSAAEDAGDPEGLIALVLQPVVVEVERLPQDATRLYAFADACPPDATTAPYLDFVLQDAARIGWVPLPEGLAGSVPARAPNVAAEAIRQMEEADGSLLPWAGLGVPLCVLSVGPGLAIAWKHRAAVARRGGMLPRGGAGQGDRLRQSRLEGLIEETEMATRRTGWNGAAGETFLRFIPPAGLLPRKCWARPDFFPAGWAIAQAPIPLSQLDAALEAARRLAPFDLDAASERVKFLVPVPDEFYDAELLQPVTTPDFDQVRVPLRHRIGDTLALRNAYRAQARTVQGVLDLAAVTDFALAEEDPVAGEAGFPADQPDPTLYDTEARAALAEVFSGLNPILFTEAQLDMVDPDRLDTAIPAGEAYGLTPFVTTLRGLVDGANDTIDFAFNRVQAEIYRLRQIMLDNEEATKLATFPALAGLAKGTNAFAMSEGLKSHFLATRGKPGTDTPTDDGGGDGDGDGGGSTPFLQPFMMFNAAPLLANVTFTATAPAASSAPKATGASFLLGDTIKDLQATTALASFGKDSAALSFGALFTEAAAVQAKDANLVKDLVDNTRAQLVDDAILAASSAKRTGILRAAPLPGDIRDIRSASIADRLAASASVNAKASAVRLKADVLRQLQAMGLSLQGLRAPLTSTRDRVLLPKEAIERVIKDTLTGDEQTQFAAEITRLRRPLADTGSEDWEVMGVTEATAATTGGRVTVTAMGRLGQALLRETAPISLALLPALTLTKQLDPDPGKGTTGDDAADDEGAYLSSAVSTLEGAIAIIRAVEARVLAIADAVETAAARLPGLAAIQGRWNDSLALADQDLDEARHDLRVALSLIDEETARLAALAAQRARILAEKVKFVAYTRPRALTAHAAGDTLGQLLPGQMDDPLPDALSRDLPLPEALAELVGALREMPLGWFASNPELAAQFDRPAYLDHLFDGMKVRALAAKARRISTPARKLTAQSAAAQRVEKIASAYSSMTLKIFDLRVSVDLSAVAAASWSERRRRALELLSLNDLIESGQQPAVARLAAAEIERIERVLQALWQLARDVPAPVRLLWAQSLSEYDTVTSLAELSRLPGWTRVAFALRNRMQRLTGWLYGRMEREPAEARALMTDLVRVALLLSAHAPVAEIVAARLDEDQTAKPGAAVDIVIRRGTPRIGMQVAFAEAGGLRARGLIRDLHGSRARVEILHTAAPMVTLTTTQTVTLFATDSLVKTP